MSEQEDVSIRFTLMLNSALESRTFRGRGPDQRPFSERVNNEAPLLIQCDNEEAAALFLSIIRRLKAGTLDVVQQQRPIESAH